MKDACHEALNDLRKLKGGYLGPVVIHAIDSHGNPYVLSTGNDGDVSNWFWSSATSTIERRKPEVELL